MTTSNFDSWFSKQVSKGLVDIKFAVMAGKGVSVEAIQQELITAELAIDANALRHPPQATSEIPDNIAAIIRQTH